MKFRKPDIVTVETNEKTTRDENGIVILNGNTVYLDPGELPVKNVYLRWIFTESEKRREVVRLLGDAWERGYGDLQWRGILPDKAMPWYVLVSNGSDNCENYEGRVTEGFGVRVRPSAFCSWYYDQNGVTLRLDVRNGSEGVIAGGRRIRLCEIVFDTFCDISAFESGKRFMKELCPDPNLPKSNVFGFNNWYYAYGKSSHKEIVDDAIRLSVLAKGLAVRPYMVVDDGWQINSCDGPWDRGNERFPDMKALADEISALGVIPGIWLRPLSMASVPDFLPDRRSALSPKYLDPSDPDVLKYVEETISRIYDWGYRLIKYDFVSYDIFLKWGNNMHSSPVGGSFHFKDRSKTSAEVIVNLYETIRRAAKDAVLVGCNTFGHLCAGLVNTNRTGDDTSGKKWARTREMGVNSLAFRLMQNGAFFGADADCVGLTRDVPWEKNKLFLDILSRSDSPLFVSWNPDMTEEGVKDAVREAFRRQSEGENDLYPIDWMETNQPTLWRHNADLVEYDWSENV